jgi:hypothetical protein
MLFQPYFFVNDTPGRYPQSHRFMRVQPSGRADSTGLGRTDSGNTFTDGRE